MADSSAMADIRGIDIDKLAKGFADEEFVLKQYCTVVPTSAREIRWYQKTAGVIDTADTTAITASQIANTASKALPFVTEQTWTRQTSYVRKYFVESPTLTEEDIRDSDIDVLATNVRDLVRAVAYQVDQRIFTVMHDTLGAGGNVNTAAATADGWDDTATGDPIKDIMTGLTNIRTYNYNPKGCILYINPIEHRNLLVYLINVKGSSIPAFASEQLKSHEVMNILDCKVVVSTGATTDYAFMFLPKVALTWKQFSPIQSAVINDVGIGRKIRVWEEGEAILTDPRAVHVITDTVA